MTMESLKRIIVTRLQWLAVLMVIMVLPVAATIQILMLQNQARENANGAFHQIRQILEENTRELETITDEYRETCLLNAESIAYMIQYNPEILGDIEEFRRIARIMEVDEIHVFDKTGCIFTGTHPEYYNFTFETGEQIGFFAPLLEDKSLRLCQDITPNTAEGKLVQYSALWSDDEEFIVQVGMYPATVMEYMEKNSLSYIFSLLQGSVGVEMYAIDGSDYTVMGATSSVNNGKTMKDLGLNPALIGSYKKGTLATVNGVDSFCMFTDMDGTLIGYVVATDALYRNAPVYILLLAVCMVAIVAVVVMLTWRFTKNYIVNGICQINDNLSAVSDGNLDERVDVRSSLEFSQLSDHINNMIRSLLATTDKMSVVLNQTNMRIGVYEYSTKMKTVRFTEHIPEILEWNSRTSAELSSDYRLLQQYFEKVLQNPVPGEQNVFRLEGRREAYIKLEEVVTGPDTLGILIDVTEDIMTRRRIERERDTDLLTGLYNRRAMERELETIFREEMGCGALIMVDADSLKYINDRFGHTIGDWYIKRIGDVLVKVGTRKVMAARQGGDEFVLLIYGYDTEEQVRKDLEMLIFLQKSTRLFLQNGDDIPVRFSFGYVMTEGRTDYPTMLMEADQQMYEAKRKRKLEGYE